MFHRDGGTRGGPRRLRRRRRRLHLGNAAVPVLRAEPARRLHVVVVVGDAVPSRARPQTCPTRQEITSSAAITPSTTNTAVYDPPPPPADASGCPCSGRPPPAGKRGAVVEDMARPSLAFVRCLRTYAWSELKGCD
nr:unnamed protein product [Digitaria exilis]